jgi:predicted secreted acid phosphatase
MPAEYGDCLAHFFALSFSLSGFLSDDGSTRSAAAPTVFAVTLTAVAATVTAASATVNTAQLVNKNGVAAMITTASADVEILKSSFMKNPRMAADKNT